MGTNVAMIVRTFGQINTSDQVGELTKILGGKRQTETILDVLEQWQGGCDLNHLRIEDFQTCAALAQW